MKTLPLAILALLGLIFGCNEASASPMVYTFSGLESGTFGGVSFNNAHVTITLFGDTANVTTGATPVPNAGVGAAILFAYLAATSARVSVDGVGTGTFLRPLSMVRLYNNWYYPEGSVSIFIESVSRNSDIWGFNNVPSLVDYTFGSSPLLTGLVFQAGTDINEPTTFGDFIVPYPVQVALGEFQAAPIPEPSTASLFAGSLVFAACCRYRKRI